MQPAPDAALAAAWPRHGPGRVGVGARWAGPRGSGGRVGAPLVAGTARDRAGGGGGGTGRRRGRTEVTAHRAGGWRREGERDGVEARDAEPAVGLRSEELHDLGVERFDDQQIHERVSMGGALSDEPGPSAMPESGHNATSSEGIVSKC